LDFLVYKFRKEYPKIKFIVKEIFGLKDLKLLFISFTFTMFSGFSDINSGGKANLVTFCYFGLDFGF